MISDGNSTIEFEAKSARFVGREFQSEQFMDDPVAASSGHAATRLVANTALTRRQVTFAANVTDAFFHVDETDEVYVQPPKKFFQRHQGGDRIWWILKKQPSGRRRAGHLRFKFHHRSCWKDAAAHPHSLHMQEKTHTPGSVHGRHKRMRT